MKTFRLFVLFSFIGVTLASCTYMVTVTDTIVEHSNLVYFNRHAEKFAKSLSIQAMDSLQFYVTEPVLMTLTTGNTEHAEIVGGKVVIKNTQHVEEIRIDKNTKGKFVKYTHDGKIAVSFDPKKPSCVVYFKQRKMENHPNDSFYVIDATWDDPVIPIHGAIEYCNEYYEIRVLGNNTYAFLAMAVDQDTKIYKDQEVLKGVEYNQDLSPNTQSPTKSKKK